MTFYKLLSRLVEMGQELYVNFVALWDTMTTPIAEEFDGIAIIETAILAWPSLGESSLIELLLGGGLGVFITITLVKWVIGIIM